MKKLFKNMTMKIIAVLLAIIIWFALANVYDPRVNITIDNVSVQLTNVNYLTDKGYGYEVIGDSKISVVVVGPQSKISNLQDADLVATADLSRMNDFSDYARIDVQVIREGIENTDLTIIPIKSAVELNITNRTIKTIPLRVEVSGNYPAYKILSSEPAVSYISVAGPAEVVRGVSYAKVSVSPEVDKDGNPLSGEINGEVSLYRENGDKNDSQSVKKSRDTVYVNTVFEKL